MADGGTLRPALEAMRQRTGVVIPVYLPEDIDRATGEALLRDNVAGYCAQVVDPAVICLSVDGARFGADVAGRLAGEFGVSTLVAPANRGKLWSAGNGARYLLERSELQYLAIADADGDHFANELLNLVRAAQHITAQDGAERLMILGVRSSRHRPLGYLRGELEELADRMLLDALFYRAVVTGRPLRLEYASTLAEFPDWHSGSKLFSRAAAEDVFLSEPQMAGTSESCYYRHACEAVMTVEALERGALLGTVNRSALNEQPISTFGLCSRTQLTADMIIWPCKRLQVPLAFARQWLDNHIPRLLLGTLVPQGREELEAIRQFVLEAYGGEGGKSARRRPLFV